MSPPNTGLRRAGRALVRAAGLALLVALPGRQGAAQNLYRQINLVSDVPGLAARLDPTLVNAWGIASSGTSPFWVSSAGMGLSTVYNTFGATVRPNVTIPLPGGGQSEPTGQVFNGTGAFPIAPGGPAATFLFATTNGTIAAWQNSLGNTAVTMVDDGASGAVYTGLGISGSTPATARLYAANFAAGTVDTYDGSFTELPAAFVDPSLPAGYSPFNVQNVGGTIYVTYAIVDPVTHDEVPGAGLGIVDAFDLNGILLHRLVNPGGSLNAPWGLALAPAGFRPLDGALLVGNFGDGTIFAFDPVTGAPRGQLLDEHGAPLVIDGLWGLRAGNGGNGGLPDRVYFAAGIDDEEHGLFGALAAVPEPGTAGLEASALGLLFGITLRRRRSAGRR